MFTTYRLRSTSSAVGGFEQLDRVPGGVLHQDLPAALALHDATLAVLGTRGYAAFTVEAVADEAGVAKSTIYRHWPTRLALIADSLEALNDQPRPDLAATTTQEHVRQLLDHLAGAFG